MTKSKGFTLIEMMIVVAVIGALSGVLVRAINLGKQEDMAKESVLQTYIEKTAATIEAYYQGENEKYPDDSDTGNPLNSGAADKDILNVYMKTWPAELTYDVNGTFSAFSIHVQKPTNPAEYLKYYSGWGEVRTCTNISSLDSCE